MKTFKGTLIAAILLLVVYAIVHTLDPPPEETPVDQGPPSMFTFEKQDLIRVEVKRPDETVTLVETDQGWLVEGPNFRASKSMVNRVKHQLHDLVARATVIEAPEDAALYGLGTQAIIVTLQFRDGEVRQFKAGDPNPSSVSYYIQPIPGDHIFTVKKSAVDYYAFTLDDFRERRFATFDTKDVDILEADLPGDRRLKFQRLDERSWLLLEPTEMDASRDKARALLGRVSALKAMAFEADLGDSPTPEALAPFGLDDPRARIAISFGEREPLALVIGDPISEEPDEPLAFVMLDGENTVYHAKQDLLNDYIEGADDVPSLRRRRFVKMHHDEVVKAEVVLTAGEDDPAEGEIYITRGVDKWQWPDGRPYAGSTADRVSIRVSGLSAEEFVDDAPTDLAQYGLATPRATIVLTAEDGRQRTVLIGAEGPSREMEEREIRRYYAKIDGEEPVYLTDRGALDVVQDLIREHGRKADRDEDIERRHEAMEQAREDEEAPPGAPEGPPDDAPGGPSDAPPEEGAP